ncbi:hypothetical protein RI367_006152 [Sorochytrium milnesiophthora]
MAAVTASTFRTNVLHPDIDPSDPGYQRVLRLIELAKVRKRAAATAAVAAVAAGDTVPETTTAGARVVVAPVMPTSMPRVRTGQIKLSRGEVVVHQAQRTAAMTNPKADGTLTAGGVEEDDGDDLAGHKKTREELLAKVFGLWTHHHTRSSDLAGSTASVASMAASSNAKLRHRSVSILDHRKSLDSNLTSTKERRPRPQRAAMGAGGRRWSDASGMASAMAAASLLRRDRQLPPTPQQASASSSALANVPEDDGLEAAAGDSVQTLATSVTAPSIRSLYSTTTINTTTTEEEEEEEQGRDELPETPSSASILESDPSRTPPPTQVVALSHASSQSLRRQVLSRRVSLAPSSSSSAHSILSAKSGSSRASSAARRTLRSRPALHHPALTARSKAVCPQDSGRPKLPPTPEQLETPQHQRQRSAVAQLHTRIDRVGSPVTQRQLERALLPPDDVLKTTKSSLARKRALEIAIATGVGDRSQQRWSNINFNNPFARIAPPVYLQRRKEIRVIKAQSSSLPTVTARKLPPELANVSARVEATWTPDETEQQRRSARIMSSRRRIASESFIGVPKAQVRRLLRSRGGEQGLSKIEDDSDWGSVDFRSVEKPQTAPELTPAFVPSIPRAEELARARKVASAAFPDPCTKATKYRARSSTHDGGNDGDGHAEETASSRRRQHALSVDAAVDRIKLNVTRRSDHDVSIIEDRIAQKFAKWFPV